MCADKEEEQRGEVMKKRGKKRRQEERADEEEEEEGNITGNKYNEEDWKEGTGESGEDDFTKSSTMETAEEYIANYIKGFKMATELLSGLKIIQVNFDSEVNKIRNQSSSQPSRSTTINLVLEVSEECSLRSFFPGASVERPQGKIVYPGFVFLELACWSGNFESDFETASRITQRKEFYEKLFSCPNEIERLAPQATKDNTLVVLVFNGHDPVDVDQLFQSPVYQSATVYLSTMVCANWKSSFESPALKEELKPRLREEFTVSQHEASTAAILQEANAINIIQETSFVRFADQLVREVKLRFRIGQSEAQIKREMHISDDEWQGNYSSLIPPTNR
jgi:hypothetical protein